MTRPPAAPRTEPEPSPAPRGHAIAATFLGGALGTALRAGIGLLLPLAPGAWPWATLLANVLGALVLGWWSVRLPRSADLDPRLHPFIATGFCGGLTTFSAMQLDADGVGAAVGLAYLTASVGLGLAAIGTGRAVARRLRAEAT